MKKIYEFKVFDILQDKENEKFLDKVKKENPDLYTKFLNLIGNKGLSIAKDRYKEFDPESVRQRQDVEKKLSSAEKKKNLKDKNDAEREAALDKYKDKIDEIENVMFFGDKNDIEVFINNDKNIQKYLKSAKYKKESTNYFNKLLHKSAKSIEYEFTRPFYIQLEKIIYKSNFWYFYSEPSHIIINIEHLYSVEDDKSVFSINLNLYDEHILPIDFDKDEKYLEGRSIYVQKKLNKFLVNKNEIINTLKELSYLLSDEDYENWKIKNDAEKYNI